MSVCFSGLTADRDGSSFPLCFLTTHVLQPLSATTMAFGLSTSTTMVTTTFSSQMIVVTASICSTRWKRDGQLVSSVGTPGIVTALQDWSEIPTSFALLKTMVLGSIRDTYGCRTRIRIACQTLSTDCLLPTCSSRLRNARRRWSCPRSRLVRPRSTSLRITPCGWVVTAVGKTESDGVAQKLRAKALAIGGWRWRRCRLVDHRWKLWDDFGDSEQGRQIACGKS